MHKLIILTFISSYLPGYKAGGPIRTIANMVDHLGDEFEFLILTLDRDLNSDEKYSDVIVNEWNNVGKARVFYASPDMFSIQGIAAILRKTQYDILYLNSFFSPNSTIIPILLRWFGCIPQTPVIIAPRGEFSKGALALKKIKKYAYLKIAITLKLYKNCIWQASSSLEAVDICRTIGVVAKKVYVAQDMLSLHTVEKLNIKRERTNLKIIFLSRISPMKNLDYLLFILKKVSVLLELSIYGTLEDINYWNECLSIIEQIPKHISIMYYGEVLPCNIFKIFSEHDLFVFPTRGENFGHVIFEALNSGTAVIVSNQTPWQADSDGAVEVLPLDNMQLWVNAIEHWANLNDDELLSRREAAQRYASLHLQDDSIVKANRQLFRDAMKSHDYK